MEQISGEWSKLFAYRDRIHKKYREIWDVPLVKKRSHLLKNYLKDGMNVVVQDYNGESLGIELPVTVDLKIQQADIAVRGDTAAGASKYVTVETGYRVQVPLFVNDGDTIRIDTRTGEYLTRV